MTQFRKKPVVIEAYQITRALLESALFDDQPYPEGLRMRSASFNKEDRKIHAWLGEVITIHNQQTSVVEGDWIITEPNGINFYPCKPDIFEQTYEPAELAAAGQVNWIKCSERLPVKYGKYLCYTKNEQRAIEIWNGTGWAYHHDIITHWQPLPDLPTEKGEGG